MSSTFLEVTTPSTSLQTRACAKVNLTLEVIGARDDGFHNLRSLVMGVQLHDSVRVEVGTGSGVEIFCSESTLNGSQNLAYRAAKVFGDYLGLDPGITIHIDKYIPLASGLGGGSSDVAATLRLCNRLWNRGVGETKLAELGSKIGSDVALFFSLPSAVIMGRGEVVESSPLSWVGWVLLVFVNDTVSTPAVYREWKPSDAQGRSEISEVVIRTATRADEISPVLFNDLEPAIYRVSPKVQGAMEVLRRANLHSFRVSGAGSTLFRLFDEREAALSTAKKIETLPSGLSTKVVRAPVANNFDESEEN